MEKMQERPALLKTSEHWSIMGDHCFLQFYDFITINSSFLSCQSLFWPTSCQHALDVVLSPPLFLGCELSHSYISFPEHADHCISSGLPDLSQICSSTLTSAHQKLNTLSALLPTSKPLFLLHFLSWVMTLSSTWLPKQRSSVSILYSSPQALSILPPFSMLFTSFHNYRPRPCHYYFLLGGPNLPLTQLKIIQELIIITTVKYLFLNLVYRLFVIYILLTFPALFFPNVLCYNYIRWPAIFRTCHDVSFSSTLAHPST